MEVHMDLRSPMGKTLHLEEIKSLRSVQINDAHDADNLFQVDIVDMEDKLHTGYTCSFECVSLICAMLYSEGDTEDKTSITISFEALVNALTMSRNAGYTDAGKGNIERDLEEEEAMEEYMSRETNVTLN